jgi:hypothetical protein
MKELENFYQLVKNVLPKDHYVPVLDDPLAFQKDVEYLDKANLVLVHMPYPSIGTSMEVAYAYFLKKVPVVGFQCINHLWLDEILKINCWNLDCLKEVLNDKKIDNVVRNSFDVYK